MRLWEFKQPLTEAARIQHAEDIVFWEGSKGATRALQSLRNLDQGGHKDKLLLNGMDLLQLSLVAMLTVSLY